MGGRYVPHLPPRLPTGLVSTPGGWQEQPGSTRRQPTSVWEVVLVLQAHLFGVSPRVRGFCAALPSEQMQAGNSGPFPVSLQPCWVSLQSCPAGRVCALLSSCTPASSSCRTGTAALRQSKGRELTAHTRESSAMLLLGEPSQLRDLAVKL